VTKFLHFPADFAWGSATAAYQVEGAWNEGGRGESIWDRFSHTPGKIKNGDNGDIACDHYHRFAADIALIKELGLNSYRFSISWPRVQPLGEGNYNQIGLDFYDRVIDCLHANNIEPFVTLYHWDLPQALEDKGGWTNRETCLRFAEYTTKMVERYSDRVKFWTTFNEPWCSYFLKKADQVAHNLLVAHGLGTIAARQAAKQPLQVGIVLNLAPTEPLREDNADDVEMARAAWRKDAGAWLDPLFKGTYPAEQIAKIADFRSGDLQIINQKLDYLGINFYTRNVVSALPKIHPIAGAHYTAMDWEVHPTSLRLLLNLISSEYDHPVIYITENGAAYDDKPDSNGYVADANRRDYLWLHLQQCALALQDGVKLKGYFAWSLMDNFEWAEGYSKRFGLVYVDYPSQKRTVKLSGKWFREVAARNSVETW
jgi:beta-glucosidase